MRKELPLSQAHRLLAPRPVCLLTTRYKEAVNVMTVAWVCPVSLRPPMVAIAIHPSRHTHDMLIRSEECALNIPGRPMLDEIVRCGSVSGDDVDKIATASFHLEDGHRIEVPWITECLAHLECAVVDTITPGDHTVFLAEVLGGWVEEEAFEEVWAEPSEDTEELSPLCHLGGRYFCLMGARVVQPAPEGE